MPWRDVNPVIRALLAIVWGTWLLLPADTLDSSAAFDFLEKLADSDLVWGAIAIAVGLLQVAELRYRHPWLLLPAVGWWTFLAAGLATGNVAGTGWITYGFIAAMSGAHTVRAYEERQLRRGDR